MQHVVPAVQNVHEYLNCCVVLLDDLCSSLEIRMRCFTCI